jgi:hypothetical protein
MTNTDKHLEPDRLAKEIFLKPENVLGPMLFEKYAFPVVNAPYPVLECLSKIDPQHISPA